MDFANYLAVEALSSTRLRLFGESPWHYRNSDQRIHTPAMLAGTLAHCNILEPDALSSRYIVVPDDAPRRPTEVQRKAKKKSDSTINSIEWWDWFQAQATDRIIIPRDQYDLCERQLAACVANLTVAELLRAGVAERSIFWADGETGIKCKCRPDWLIATDDGSIVVDIKTCNNASPSAFGRSAARLRYDLQAAHYIAGIESDTGKPVNQFIFVAVTNVDPVLAVPYMLPDCVMAAASDERLLMLDRLSSCMRDDRWPAYGDGLLMAEWPAYASREREEIEWVE